MFGRARCWINNPLRLSLPLDACKLIQIPGERGGATKYPLERKFQGGGGREVVEKTFQGGMDIFCNNIVHSILCLNLLLLIMNHATRPESSFEVASCSYIYRLLVFVDQKCKSYFFFMLVLLLLLGAGRRPSQGFASVFSPYY